jgi:hypothetical protein
MRAFRLVGFLLLILLFGWIGCTVLFQTGYQKPPTFLGLGSAFEGSLQLPVEKITAAFEAARSRMLAVNDRWTEFRIVCDVAGWLSFAATAAITLIVGFYGRPVPAAGAAPDTQGLPARSVRLIGVLAALAAILTGFGNLASVKSGDYYKRADTIRDLIVRSRAEVIDAKTAEAAQAVLDELALQASR